MDRDSIRSLGEAYEQQIAEAPVGDYIGGGIKNTAKVGQTAIDQLINIGRAIGDLPKNIQGNQDAVRKYLGLQPADREAIRKQQRQQTQDARQGAIRDIGNTVSDAAATATGNENLRLNLSKDKQQAVSRGEGSTGGTETPEQRAARRAKVGLTGNGEGGSETGITSDVAAKQNAADDARGRSTVRDTATGEPTNVQQASDTTPQKDETTPAAGAPAAGGGNLTPMQQWAKNFPKLAAKVRPGQAGYDEIQKMKSPEPKEVAASSPNLSQKVSQVKNNTSTSFSKPTNLKPNNSPTIKSPKLDMNKAQNKVKTAFGGLPEESQSVLIDYLMRNNLCESEDHAKVVVEHMSPEYQDHILISEGWVEDAAKNIRKGASAAASAGGAAIKGLKGEKISGSRNAVDRSLNSIGRTSHNVGTRFGRALTGAGATTSPKKAETKTQTPKQETKNDSTPAPKAEVKSTPSNSSTPSSSSSSNSGNKGKSGGRLDKALDWASDPKNKDAWMGKTRKEEYNSIEDAYNSMYNLSLIHI